MSSSSQRVAERLRRLIGGRQLDSLIADQSAPTGFTESLPTRSVTDTAARERRWKQIDVEQSIRDIIEPKDEHWADSFEKNIENLIGRIEVPLGVAGPLTIRGLIASGHYWLPLATTEAALVASINRGCRAIRESGGANSVCLAEGVSRAPCFCFESVVNAGKFCVWLSEQIDNVRQAAESTSNFAKLMDLRFTVEGNHVYLIFEYETGDAAGQNMVTIATEAACEWIIDHSNEPPKRWYVEGNMSGDKKPSLQSFMNVRGRKVTSEVVIPEPVVKRYLRTTPFEMEAYWRVSALGGVQSGTIGVQGHYANTLAAMYLATGQDVACVAEASIGVTRMETTDDGGLYASVTLPNLIVGTVGGGNGLPTASACLKLMGLCGTGNATALAEVITGACLAGELSIIAALSAGQFTSAHRKLARGKPPKTGDGCK